jgi:hypothetical protein
MIGSTIIKDRVTTPCGGARPAAPLLRLGKDRLDAVLSAFESRTDGPVRR